MKGFIATRQMFSHLKNILIGEAFIVAILSAVAISIGYLFIEISETQASVVEVKIIAEGNRNNGAEQSEYVKIERERVNKIESSLSEIKGMVQILIKRGEE